MKQLISLPFLLIVFSISTSHAQTIELKRVPSGNDTINSKIISVQGFDMSNEITNKEYREFVNYLKRHPNDSLKTIGGSVQHGKISFKRTSISNGDALKDIIDSTAMDGKINHYFSNPAYDNYPVVGVSYNNANLFCIWKTNMEKAKSGESEFIIMYRIPTSTEWLRAASFLNKEWPIPDDEKGTVQPVKSGNFDKNGLYNLSGNVSEWTSSTNQKGERIVMGGSWKTKHDKNERTEMLPDKETDYIGFRIVTTYLGRAK